MYRPTHKDDRYSPKGLFPSGNLPNVQFLKWQLTKYVLAEALGPLACSGLSTRPLACSRRSARPPRLS